MYRKQFFFSLLWRPIRHSINYTTQYESESLFSSVYSLLFSFLSGNANTNVFPFIGFLIRFSFKFYEKNFIQSKLSSLQPIVFLFLGWRGGGGSLFKRNKVSVYFSVYSFVYAYRSTHHPYLFQFVFNFRVAKIDWRLWTSIFPHFSWRNNNINKIVIIFFYSWVCVCMFSPHLVFIFLFLVVLVLFSSATWFSYFYHRLAMLLTINCIKCKY